MRGSMYARNLNVGKSYARKVVSLCKKEKFKKKEAEASILYNAWNSVSLY